MHRSKKSSKTRKGARNNRLLPTPRLPSVSLTGLRSSLSSKAAVYPKLIKLDIPIGPLTLSVAAGALSTVFAIGVTASGAAPLGSLGLNLLTLFNEFCICGARFEIRVQNPVNPQGCVWVTMDEKVAAGPTLGNVADKQRISMLIGAESPSRYMVSWKAEDYTDLEWQSSAVLPSPVSAYLKFFASNGGTGTGASTACNLLLTGTFAMSFRGFN